MHAGFVGEVLREAVPLAAAAQPEDDRVQGGSLVYAEASCRFGRIVLF
jgi:hypothetical protein